MYNDVEKVLLTEEQIQNRVQSIANAISVDIEDDDLVVVGILKGANIFMSDLVRKIDKKITMDFMVVSSYGNSTQSSGVVKIIKDLDIDIENRNVLIIEDIVDTGLTLSYLKDYLLTRKAKSVKICTLLNKPSRRKKSIDIDYIGFEVPDEFIIGYGIDYAEQYRNLPYVASLKREIYEK